MEKLKRISIQSTMIAAVAAVALTGCAGTPTASVEPTTPASTTEPERVDPAVELVGEYLEAIAEGDDSAAWALLSPEAQEIYVTEQVYADARAIDGSVSPEHAALLLDAGLVSYAVPDSQATQVSASTGMVSTDETAEEIVADAWIVRDTDAGPRIDDVGEPATGPTPYTWRNPDLEAGTPFDEATPATIYFQRIDNGTDVLPEPPATISAWIDGTPSTVTLDVAAGSGAEYIVDSPAVTGQVLTLAWILDPASPLWRTTTIVL